MKTNLIRTALLLSCFAVGLTSCETEKEQKSEKNTTASSKEKPDTPLEEENQIGKGTATLTYEGKSYEFFSSIYGLYGNVDENNQNVVKYYRKNIDGKEVTATRWGVRSYEDKNIDHTNQSPKNINEFSFDFYIHHNPPHQFQPSNQSKTLAVATRLILNKKNIDLSSAQTQLTIKKIAANGEVDLLIETKINDKIIKMHIRSVAGLNSFEA